jgi:hypothetical protein
MSCSSVCEAVSTQRFAFSEEPVPVLFLDDLVSTNRRFQATRLKASNRDFWQKYNFLHVLAAFRPL